ncbi:MAG: SDR family oxidoreductase [Candidatus Omnitrophica bacterium]|nr:SDR family oxidoreductase [Candidatus Omnitrophota bacterium]
MEIKGKNVVILGATGGIGRALAFAFAAKGANLILTGRRKLVLEALKQKLFDFGVSVKTYKLNVTREKDFVSFARKLKSQIGSIDVLINAFGVGIYKSLEDMNFNDFKKSLDVNLNGVFLSIKYLLPFLENSKLAYVVSLGSGMGKVGVAKRLAYCASKFGLRGLMLSLAKEYRNKKIKFCLLTLGSVLTSFGPLTLEEKLEKQKRGKKYLDPVLLAKTIVSKIENGTLIEETTIYPKKYFEESKKGLV